MLLAIDHHNNTTTRRRKFTSFNESPSIVVAVNSENRLEVENEDGLRLTVKKSRVKKVN